LGGKGPKCPQKRKYPDSYRKVKIFTIIFPKRLEKYDKKRYNRNRLCNNGQERLPEIAFDEFSFLPFGILSATII
jgi:hypothetical protein